MKRPQGYAYTFSPDGEVAQQSITCSHCDFVVFVDEDQTATQAGCGYCPECELHTCPRCKNSACTPAEARLQEMEART